MGIYDPSFRRKPFNLVTRDGEVPGSVVIGKGSTNKGCVWPGQNGKWFAAMPGQSPDEKFPSFDSRDAALDYIVAPIRETHERRENERQMAWMAAEPKRAARAAKSRDNEAKRLSSRRSGKVYDVLNESGEVIGAVVRKLEADAIRAAASLLGFSSLPEGYSVRERINP